MLTPILRVGQSLAVWVVGLFAVLMLAVTLCAAFGTLPWATFALYWNGALVPEAGMWGQIGLTILSAMIALVLPANARMAKLESAHRSFAIGLEDVARAYRIAHSADRAGVFSLSTEFDSIRARLEHLRNHPDLSSLEPELLQLAAEMSFLSRDLARTYSDDRVRRARSFLQQRQEEAEALSDRIKLARMTVDELRRWLTDIETEERQAERHIKRLEEDLREILPQIGYAIEADEPRDATVVQMPKHGK